eukprot:m.37828 g.37828  ORF g.37828 m.37828 type:complete len:173 (+) comp9356_c0_seq4:204-722(+)
MFSGDDSQNIHGHDEFERLPLRDVRKDPDVVSVASSGESVISFDGCEASFGETLVILLKAPIALAVSCVLFLAGVIEGLVRLIQWQMRSRAIPAVMPGENIMFDVMMALWYTWVLRAPDEGYRSRLHQSSVESGMFISVRKAELKFPRVWESTGSLLVARPLQREPHASNGS